MVGSDSQPNDSQLSKVLQRPLVLVVQCSAVFLVSFRARGLRSMLSIPDLPTPSDDDMFLSFASPCTEIPTGCARDRVVIILKRRGPGMESLKQHSRACNLTAP